MAIGILALGLDYVLRTSIGSVSETIGSTRSSATSIHSTTLEIPQNPSRLLVTTADFEKLRQLVASEVQAQSLYSALRSQAEWTIRDEPPFRYESVAADSGPFLRRIYSLALMYRLEGDTRYAERAWQELQGTAQFPDWNPNGFLDTATITHAFAVGYDWLAWSDEQKRILRDAIVEKGLRPALESYHRNERSWSNRHGWVNAEHNWNMVCNGGIGMGALALLPEEPDLCKEILANAIKSLPRAMQHFAPDGGWSEGPHYWNYGTFPLCAFLASLEMITGSDSDLSQIPGFAATGLFPIYLTGAAGYVFNFADTWSDRSLQAPHMFWLAHKFGQKVYAWYAQTYVSNPESADPGGAVGPSLGLVWFQPDRDPVSEGLPLDKHFRGTEVATFRSAWNDPDGVFLGFKAGDNRVNHSHLDIGSFVLDALGQRWALDLGKDDYSLSGYFEKYSGQRWTYYRMRAEGHNTLVLNPSSGPDQNPAATAKITRFESNANKKFAIADLTPAYGQTLQRGIALLNGDSVIVQDELFPSRPTQLWWFMHTSAEIELR